MPIPNTPGWYWAKWKIADEGTRDGDDALSGDRWEVVDVYNPTNPDGELRVFVSGVERTQSLENFFWGPGPLEMPK